MIILKTQLRGIIAYVGLASWIGTWQFRRLVRIRKASWQKLAISDCSSFSTDMRYMNLFESDRFMKFLQSLEILMKRLFRITEKASHLIRECCSSSTSFLCMHIWHVLISLSIFLCLPVSTLRLCELVLIIAIDFLVGKSSGLSR